MASETRCPVPGAIAAVGWPRPSGWRVLVPGWPQARWGQRERALALGGSYVSALGVGLFAWGTPAGVALLALAFAMHVAAAADAIGQEAFPSFGRWVPAISASAGLGLGYLPALVAAWVMAWPVPDATGDRPGGYLVNRWAYRSSEPMSGQWLWVDGPGPLGPGPARLAARGGQEVEWLAGVLRVDGARTEWAAPASAGGIESLRFRVPEGCLLIEPQAGRIADEGGSLGLIVVEAGRVRGRVWAQHAPFWRRRLLLR